MLKHVFKKLQEPSKKWRKILKALMLMNTVIKNGSQRAVSEFSSKLFLVKNLYEFSYIEGTMDRGVKGSINSKGNSKRSSEGYRDRGYR